MTSWTTGACSQPVKDAACFAMFKSTASTQIDRSIGFLKELMIADERGIFFTTPHWNSYPAVLMRKRDLKQIPKQGFPTSSPRRG